MNEKRYSALDIELKRLQVALEHEKGKAELMLMRQQIDLNSMHGQSLIKGIEARYEQLVGELDTRTPSGPEAATIK